jgi:carboxypeptidase C (cathepsin A)
MDAKPKDGDLPERILPADETITKTAEATIRGQRVPYRVTTGTQPVYGEDGQTIAALYYTFYERTDVDDTARRPLFISFNGGPGSGSLWMHLGYTSPKQLVIDDEGYPIQPYGVRDNPHSILDVADIVYVNPVNTGFSRILDPEVDRETFFGVEADVTYLADWINVFVSRHERWRSPKYLIGESYGTTRVSGLAGQLQNRHWMYLNGVILVSPTGLGMTPEGPAPRSAVLKLPYYTAAAHYHGQLGEDLQSLALADALAEAETFTLDEYLPALSRGGFLDETRRSEIARKVALFTGLSEEFVIDHNLAVPSSAFWRSFCATRATPSADWTRATWASIARTPASATTTRPSSPPGTTRSHPRSTTTCATCLASRPTCSTTCSAGSTPGRAATPMSPRSCGRRWRRTPTFTSWCSRASTTARRTTSPPSTCCGISIRAAD